MSDHPLGTPTNVTSAVDAEPSIVDQILNLDKLLSADVRRAEKTARICLRADLEARLDELEAELETLVDPFGNPLEVSGPDRAIGDTAARDARAVALEIRQVQQEMAAETFSVRLRQMSDDDWQAFQVRHKKAFDTTGASPERTAMFNALVVDSAVAPKMTTEKWIAVRGKLGAPQVDEIINVAWSVNTKSGVSVPKSQGSSQILKRKTPSQS